jgi:hypothetical protein
LRSSLVPEGAFLESTVLGPVFPIAGDLGLVMTKGTYIKIEIKTGVNA